MATNAELLGRRNEAVARGVANMHNIYAERAQIADKAHIEYSGYYHELHNDIDNECFFVDMVEWLGQFKKRLQLGRRGRQIVEIIHHCNSIRTRSRAANNADRSSVGCLSSLGHKNQSLETRSVHCGRLKQYA